MDPLDNSDKTAMNARENHKTVTGEILHLVFSFRQLSRKFIEFEALLLANGTADELQTS